jgi:hypothetical protein
VFHAPDLDLGEERMTLTATDSDVILTSSNSDVTRMAGWGEGVDQSARVCVQKLLRRERFCTAGVVQC